jgi:phthalate 4,5-dioxygenase reductase component
MSSSNTIDSMMPLRISRTFDVADGIRSFELVHPHGDSLPPFTPGSHVKVLVPNGAVRKYSLCNAPQERQRYLIAVKRDAGGRGGSVSLVDQAREGDVLPTSAPENAFPLVDTAPEYLFIAGGIGITPIMSMIGSIGELLHEAAWKLYYLTRSPEHTAFRQELDAPELSPRVLVHHDYGDSARSFDLWPLFEQPSRAHVYCCGPRGLMEAVRAMTGHWPRTSVHFESFEEGGVVQEKDRQFTVTLARSGRRLEVPVGETILAVLREGGLALPSSCESGCCGTCKTRLLSGEADHRDMVLMPEEQRDQIMICVSRAKTSELVLDL